MCYFECIIFSKIHMLNNQHTAHAHTHTMERVQFAHNSETNAMSASEYSDLDSDNNRPGSCIDRLTLEMQF